MSYLLKGFTWIEITILGFVIGVLLALLVGKHDLPTQAIELGATLAIVAIIKVVALGEAWDHGHHLIRVAVPWQSREVQVGDLWLLSISVAFVTVIALQLTNRRLRGGRDS